MPFSERCLITLENDSDQDEKAVYYQINYTLGDEVSEDMARFHCQIRREKPAPKAPFLLLDTANTPGVFVGMNASALPCSEGTWREGDFRFYFDGDRQASIVGTGWSDWFLSGWGLGVHESAYAGSSYQVDHPDFSSKYFCSSYRFHVTDPIYFSEGLKAEHDTRGFASMPEEYAERRDDWCATVYWYQHLQGSPISRIPDRQARVEGIGYQAFEPNYSMPDQEGTVKPLEVEG